MKKRMITLAGLLLEGEAPQPLNIALTSRKDTHKPNNFLTIIPPNTNHVFRPGQGHLFVPFHPRSG